MGYTVFGYGSLIFKVGAKALPPIARIDYPEPPPHVISQSACFQRIRDMQESDPLPAPGFLKGYVRRFAQESHDHRGTEEVSNDAVPLCTLP